ncbi:MAG: LPXTG cell wall anchor domain-containing protein [Acidimicrobiales bacterium]
MTRLRWPPPPRSANNPFPLATRRITPNERPRRASQLAETLNFPAHCADADYSKHTFGDESWHVEKQLTRSLVGAVALAAMLAGPALAQEYPVQNGTLALSDTNNDGKISAGESLRITGGGYAPGAEVQITVGTTPTVLGVTIANAAGEIATTVVLPSSFAGATQTVNATGANASGGILVLGIQVTVAQAAATNPAPAAANAGGSGQLAYTGSETNLMLAGGLALVAAGGALVAYRKRSLTEA